jgi:MFS family permease
MPLTNHMKKNNTDLLSQSHKINQGSGSIPKSVWALSLSTFFLNFSSTIVFVLMPSFLTQHCQFSCSSTGALEGAVEGFSLFTRAITGMVSDALKRRRSFLILGYGISFFSRIILASAGVLSWVVFSRFSDKMGNGLQASPREAYISDVTPKQSLGKAYGLNKSLGMIGSFSASFLLFFIALKFSIGIVLIRTFFYISAGLALLSTLFLMFGIRDPEKKREGAFFSCSFFIERFRQLFLDLKHFDSRFWISLGVIFLFKLGYFSGAFLMIWLAKQNFSSFLGFSLVENRELASCMVLLLQNGSCALFSYPLGFLSDLIDRRYVVAIGVTCMLGSLMCLGLGAKSPLWMTVGILLYGVQMSMQGALMALLSSTMPKEYKGTGFGIFFFTSGIGVLMANAFFMKYIWDIFSPEAAFLSICLPIFLALCLLPFIPLNKTPKESAE